MSRVNAKNILFRPPYGKITSCQIKKLKRFTILFCGTSWHMILKYNSISNKKNILQNINKGSIIVLHNNQTSYKNLKPILSEIIDSIKMLDLNFHYLVAIQK